MPGRRRTRSRRSARLDPVTGERVYQPPACAPWPRARCTARSGRSTRRGPRRLPLLNRVDEVAERAGAPRCDHGHVHRVGHRTGQLELVAVLGAVAIHARQQDLPGAALDALARPRDGVAANGRAAAVHVHAVGIALAARVDGQDHALGSEHLGHLAEQLRAPHGRRVDRHLVRPGVEHGLRVGRRAHAPADREGDEHVVRAAARELRHGFALLVRGGDVEEDDLVGPLVLVAHRQLHRVAGIAQVHELHALDHAALVHVEAGDHASQQHQARGSSAAWPSATPNRPS